MPFVCRDKNCRSVSCIVANVESMEGLVSIVMLMLVFILVLIVVHKLYPRPYIEVGRKFYTNNLFISFTLRYSFVCCFVRSILHAVFLTKAHLSKLLIERECNFVLLLFFCIGVLNADYFSACFVSESVQFLDPTIQVR